MLALGSPNLSNHPSVKKAERIPMAKVPVMASARPMYLRTKPAVSANGTQEMARHAAQSHRRGAALVFQHCLEAKI